MTNLQEVNHLTRLTWIIIEQLLLVTAASGCVLRLILSCNWLELRRLDLSCGWFYPVAPRLEQIAVETSYGWNELQLTQVAADSCYSWLELQLIPAATISSDCWPNLMSPSDTLKRKTKFKDLNFKDLFCKTYCFPMRLCSSHFEKWQLTLVAAHSSYSGCLRVATADSSYG